MLPQPLKKNKVLRHTIEWGLVWATTYGLPIFTLIWIYNMCIDFNPTHLYIFIFFAYLLGINTTTFMHRAWCHRAWVPNKWLNICALIIHNIGCTGKTLAWAAVHRKHHRFSDTEKDPHSPYYKGKFYVATAVYDMDFPKDIGIYSKDLIKDPIHMWFSNYYWVINVSLWTLLAIININWLILWLGIIGFHMIKNKSFNVLGHNDSSTKESTNSIFYAWLYLHGEPWHRNHHLDPTNWRFGHKWYEIDLGARFIQLCVWLGWGKIRSFERD
jgi:stearoyl-CoA desaturase (delta-9 desaturase)